MNTVFHGGCQRKQIPRRHGIQSLSVAGDTRDNLPVSNILTAESFELIPEPRPTSHFTVNNLWNFLLLYEPNLSGNAVFLKRQKDSLRRFAQPRDSLIFRKLLRL